MAESNGRASRRRRIVEGSSDRIAMITGRFQNLPPPSSSLPSSASSSQHHHHSFDVSTLDEHDDDRVSMSLTDKNFGQSSRRDALNFGSQLEPELYNSGETAKAIPNVIAEFSSIGKQSQVTSLVQRDSVDKEPVQKLHWQQRKFFTAKELSSCITASESTRIFGSILIALLVVLSYVDYPLLGINIVNSKSIIAAKPLYMLLMTDIIVVVAHLILERQRRFESPEEDEEVVQEKGLNWDLAVRILERGLVAHQTIRAIFIDCSLYVVIVLCGLSLV